jgi:hypothetical protein
MLNCDEPRIAGQKRRVLPLPSARIRRVFASIQVRSYGKN